MTLRVQVKFEDCPPLRATRPSSRAKAAADGDRSGGKEESCAERIQRGKNKKKERKRGQKKESKRENIE